MFSDNLRARLKYALANDQALQEFLAMMELGLYVPGNVFYADSVNGSDLTKSGKAPDQAKAK